MIAKPISPSDPGKRTDEEMAIATENGIPPARLQVLRIPVETGRFRVGEREVIDFEVQPLAR